MNAEILSKAADSLLKITSQKVKALERLGIYSVKDLLLHKPSHYIIKAYNPAVIKDTKEQVVLELAIQKIELARRRGAPSKIQCIDKHNHAITLIFFNPIHKVILQYLHNNPNIIVEGKIEKISYNIGQIVHPELIFNKAAICLIEPIYPLTYGLINKQLHGYILKAQDALPHLAAEFNPFVKEHMPSLKEALENIHKPSNINDYLKKVSLAIERLALDEALAHKLNLAEMSTKTNEGQYQSYAPDVMLQKQILDKLNFHLSPGQQEVIKEIEADQKATTRMIRMLQGDVGSGKTLVALLTAINAVCSKMQAAIMAPTDLLARQHYSFFYKALSDESINVALLTGKTKAKAKKLILEQLQNGTIQIIIGTHSLFQDDVVFNNLGYIVIDEQHRFGVKQRLQLINKSNNADILAMTATPIPRSLALTLFGNMAISKLVNNIQNRKPIITSTLHSAKINDLIFAMNRKLDLKEKIYWVCPLIEEQTEEEPTKKLTAALSRYENLKTIFNDRVALIHGQTKVEERDEIMEKFKHGNVDILVATTVIEVGIDVGNATLIIIEHAENFGLAQLHQLRGRVGRSHLISHCVLMYSYPMSNTAKERLASLKSSNDGFYIAEVDLKLRGGGDVLGVRQSGIDVNFTFLDIYKQTDIIAQVIQNEENITLNYKDSKYALIKELFNKDNIHILE